MADSPETLAILEEIRALLRVMARPRLKAAVKRIESGRGPRKRIFRLFNGRLTADQIAKRVKVTPRAVRAFASECEAEGLVEFVPNPRGRGRCPQRVI